MENMVKYRHKFVIGDRKMSYKIKEINFHITEFCEGHCPMCYATDDNMKRKHGDINTLKLIAHNAIKYGKVERFVMVGGNPCEHPYLVDLIKFIKEEGKEYNIDTKTMIILNTHYYKKNGKSVDIEDVAKYIDGMCFTVHADNAEEHDSFNGCPGSYEHAINNLKKYAKLKNKKQEICIIVNLMPQTVNNLKKIMININKNLNSTVDGFAIQRIAPIGRACGTEKYFIEQSDVNKVFEVCKEMKNEYGFFFEFVDAFPFCILKKEYREMLPKGGCIWGKDYCAVFSDGTVSRCAMSENKLSKNVLDLDTKEKFEKFWNTDKELDSFRRKDYLDDKCKKCKLLEKCGGGCVLARKTGDPYKKEKLEVGHDYLAKRM